MHGRWTQWNSDGATPKERAYRDMRKHKEKQRRPNTKERACADTHNYMHQIKHAAEGVIIVTSHAGD